MHHLVIGENAESNTKHNIIDRSLRLVFIFLVKFLHLHCSASKAQLRLN